MTRPLFASSRRRKRCEETMQGWSDLPEGPLYTILMCLCSLVDLISFSSVCSSWRTVASQGNSLFPPLLLCPTITRYRLISSLNLLDPTTPSFSSSLSHHLKKFASFVSYSHGHLLGLSQNRVVIILNPFTGGELCSPRITTNHKISSASLLLTNPLPSPNSGILLYAADYLFYWRIGSPSWYSHWCPRLHPCGELIVVTMQGNVYAMDILDNLYVLDLSPNLHLRPLAIEGIGARSFSMWHTLVDCGGELLHLQLTATDEVISAQLEAFRLDLSVNKMRWVKKETLGNWAIFVGCNHGVPGIAVHNPERWGGRSNCVYFATRNAYGDSPWVAIKLGDRIDSWDPESPLFIGNFRHQLSLTWVRPGF